MKLIKKGREPESLTQYKLQNKNDANYKAFNSGQENEKPENKRKEKLKKSLLEEQGYICCYCMKRISQDKMRIEHWRPQSHPDLQAYPILQLEYSNLLAACQGGEGGSKYQYHCDKSKDNDLITIHPQEKINLPLKQGEAIGISCEALVKFNSGDGRVYSDNQTINKELNDILCLNDQNLKEARVAVLEELKKILSKKYPGTWRKNTLEKFLEIYSDKSGGKYKPYCRVIISFLEKSLKKI